MYEEHTPYLFHIYEQVLIVISSRYDRLLKVEGVTVALARA